MSGRTVVKGYGEAHKRLRRQLEAVVKAGDAICCRCGLPIDPHDPRGWDLDHSDHDRTEYNDGPTGPMAHVRCNRTAGSRRAVRARARKRALDPKSGTDHSFIDPVSGRKYWWSRPWLAGVVRREDYDGQEAKP